MYRKKSSLTVTLLHYLKISILLCAPILTFSETKTIRNLDSIVAVVNHTPILYSNLTFAQKTYLPNISLIQIRERLIDQALLLQIAERFHLSISEKTIQNTIQKIAQQNNHSVSELKTQLAHQGLSFASYRKIIHNQLLIHTLQQQAIAGQLSLKDEEVRSYLQKTENRTPLYHIQDYLIPIPTRSGDNQKKAHSTALKIALNLQKGMTPEAASMQDLGWQPATGLPDIFLADTKRLKINQLSHPILAENGYHVLKLVGKKHTTPHLSLAEARQFLLNKKAQSVLHDWHKKVVSAAYIKRFPLNAN